MKPTLSIIIPCYNCQDTLEEAVESCFVQRLDNFEIVMVDDGSTDDTKLVMQKLADKHSEIKLFYHDKNMGGGATRNTAVKHAESEVIFCLDSDDLLPEGTLSSMLSYMKEKKCDGVGVHKSIKFRGRNLQDIVYVDTFGYAGEKIPFDSLLQKTKGLFCPLYSTFMITKKAFNAIDGYPEYHGFDTQGMAWRFLAGGFVAYTCPEATYFHRVEFKKSYYMREAEDGKVNYNWQDILKEHIFLFTEETQKFILNFNCKDFSKNIFEEFKNRDRIFKENYLEFLGTPRIKERVISPKRTFISRWSIFGIYIRAREKIKKNKILYPVAVYFYAFLLRIKKLFNEGESKKKYYEQIKKIKANKKIVLAIQHGGLGDWLAFTTLPRLLYEKYGIEFYLSKRSLDVLRNKDIYKLCFELNPYFKGVIDDEDVFILQLFSSEKSWWTLFTGMGAENVVSALERQFGCKDEGLPEIYYEPHLLLQYKNTVLVDNNFISGKKQGWQYDEASLNREIQKELAKDKKRIVEYADPSKQNLFVYTDMIYSCSHFITVLSGGAVLALCFKKPFTALYYNNVSGEIIDLFVFKNGVAVYVK